MLVNLFLIIGVSVSVVGCEKGPAEKAGEKLDRVMTDTGNKVEDLCEDAKEGLNVKDKDC